MGIGGCECEGVREWKVSAGELLRPDSGFGLGIGVWAGGDGET